MVVTENFTLTDLRGCVSNAIKRIIKTLAVLWLFASVPLVFVWADGEQWAGWVSLGPMVAAWILWTIFGGAIFDKIGKAMSDS